jgi:hypothetical protein
VSYLNYPRKGHERLNNGRQTQKKWKTTSKKIMEDNLKKNKNMKDEPQKKWRAT